MQASGTRAGLSAGGSRPVVNRAALGNYLLGPFGDMRRMLLGALVDLRLIATPPTRRLDPADLAAARATLTAAGCRLQGLTCENLHTASIALTIDSVYLLFRNWRAWPRSGFLACPATGPSDETLFSYRFWGLIPVVRMHLFAVEQARHIIFAVDGGFGHGGYHAFLFAAETASRSTLVGARSSVSIFTLYPPQPFLTGLHDQTNRDIFRKLEAFVHEQ